MGGGDRWGGVGGEGEVGHEDWGLMKVPCGWFGGRVIVRSTMSRLNCF